MNDFESHHQGKPPTRVLHLSNSELQVYPRPSEQVATYLLERANLPTSDLTREKLETFFVGKIEGAAVGIVGLELYANVGLLRSLAVTGNARSKGVGSELVRYAETFAASKGVNELYLLTMSASGFFNRHNYRPVPRQAVPAEIRHTREFSTICPTSSTVMKKGLGGVPVLPK